MSQFIKITQQSAGSFPSIVDEIKTGDFNGDGILDVVISRIYFGLNSTHRTGDNGTTPSELQVLVGNGSGNFLDRTAELFNGQIPTTNYVARMLVADFNNDRISDVFLIESGPHTGTFSGGQNRLMLSSLGGHMLDSSNSLPQMLKFGHGASTGDLNHDGLLDIFTNATIGGNDLQINNGLGKYVLAPAILPKFTVNKAYGEFTQTNTASALIDLNMDGKLDIVLGCWGNPFSPNFSQVFLADSQGGFSRSLPINLPKSSIPLETVLDIKQIDLNGDMFPDLVVSLTTEQSEGYYQIPYIQLLVNDGDGLFHDETSIRFSQDLKPTGNSSDWIKTVYVEDLNRDGYQDIVLNYYFGSSKALINNGYGSFSQEIAFSKDQSVGIGDINSDGLTDIIGIGRNGQIDIWINTMASSQVYKANFGGSILNGSSRADLFISGSGNDTFDGKAGIDTASYSGGITSYKLSREGNDLKIFDGTANRDGTDTLTNVERLQFSDVSLALDLDGNAGQVAKTLGAVFGVSTVNNKEYVGIGLSSLDGGMTYEALMGLALKAKLGNALSHATVVNLLHTNVMGAAPTQAERDFYVGLLDSGVYNPMSLGVLAAETPLNATNIDLVGLSQTGLEFLPV